jgi:hypothetical protein
MLRIFSPEKIGQLRPGANLRFWVPEASMLTTRPPKSLQISLSVLFGSQKRQRLLLYTSLIDLFYNRGGKCLQRGTD